MVPCGVKREQALQCPLLVLFKLGYACLEMCDLGLQVVYLPILHALLRGSLWKATMEDPEDGVPKHSFGLVAAVYNYNRCSAFITDVLVKVFEMVALNFCDDNYGFETELTAPSAKLAAEQRKQKLLDTIDSVLESGSLDPGLASKLKGKLMSDKPALGESRRLIQFGPPREISLRSEKPSDVVIFTDGFTPDQRKEEVGPDRVGAVMFDRRAQAPKQFAEVIPREISEKWIPRKTQIVPIEMLAPILAIETFRGHLRNKDVLLFIDSEAVEAALVKGYSSKEDLCELVEIFWELALKYKINFFIDRVSTDANPADWPSRHQLSRDRPVSGLGDSSDVVARDARGFLTCPGLGAVLT
ncbi:unnamed protein product [Symbiodinium sp. KB8]|nr:unnamed protein product [Symbiodinium sp. KB8]